MEKQKLKRLSDRIILLGSVVFFFTVINVFMSWLTRSEIGTLRLARTELGILNQEQRVIASSNELADTYKDEIEVISRVFPTEQTIPEFIDSVERSLSDLTSVYSLKINTHTPLAEQDKLYILLTVTLQADVARLREVLQRFEKLPYIMHVTSISMKSEGFESPGDIQINLKLYVQNPFTTQ